MAGAEAEAAPRISPSVHIATFLPERELAEAPMVARSGRVSALDDEGVLSVNVLIGF